LVKIIRKIFTGKALKIKNSDFCNYFW